MNLIKGIYRLTRVENVLPYALFLTLLAAFVVDDQIGIVKLVIAIMANILGACFANMINDVEDAEDDSMDPKKAKRNPVSAGIITKKQAYTVTFIEAGIALFLYALLGASSLGAGIAVIISGFFYSWKSVRLKSIAWIDFISHQYFLASGLVLAAYLAFSHFDSSIILPLIGSGFVSSAGDLYNELRDFVVDKKAGLKNTAQLLGEASTTVLKNVFTILGALFIVASIILNYQKIFLPALILIPVVIFMVVLYNRLKSKTPLLHFDNMLIYDPILHSFSIVLALSILLSQVS